MRSFVKLSMLFAALASIVILYLGPIHVLETVWPEPECVAEGGYWNEEDRTCQNGTKIFKETLSGRVHLN